MSEALTNQVVLITRPDEPGQALAAAVRKLGAQVLLYPTIAIHPVENLPAHSQVFDRLSAYDLAIFISRNAVNYGVPLLRAHGADRWQAQVLAIGAGTAAALATAGMAADQLPDAQQRFTTETLLELPLLQVLRGTKVLIVRGRGGRPDLGDALQARGAQLDYFECYERALPDVTVQGKLDILHPPVTIVVCTSNEMLQNLVTLTNESQRPQLLQLPVVVLSERAQQFAQQLGFRKPALVADNATQDAIVAALVHSAQQN